MLVQDKQRGNLDDIFENVSVISFNYDRNIRRFLPLVLQSQFALPEDQTRELSAKLPIYHPYGSLGPLPWEVGNAKVPYGKVTIDTLAVAAGNLRTFTEQIEDETQLAGMYAALSSAEQIVFLGFSYLPQNMELLTRGVAAGAREILGTSLGLSEQDQELVTRQLDVLLVEHFRPHKSARLSSMECANFIRENFRTLTS
jgi:hypothetical protein